MAPRTVGKGPMTVVDAEFTEEVCEHSLVYVLEFVL